MAVKMPVLGDGTGRRRRQSHWGVWLLLAAAIVAGGYAWRWRAQRRGSTAQALTASATDGGVPAGAPSADAGASASLLPAPLAPGPRALSLQIDGALETALVQEAGRESGPALAQVLKRLLVWWIRVPGDLRRGDRIDLVYEERAGDEPVVYAVRLVSAKLQRTVEAFRFQRASESFGRFYLPDGQELEMRLDPSPLDNYEQVTSLIRDGRGHKGVDFKTPAGSPVKATFDGAITRKNWFFRGNGNSLEVTESAPPHRKALFLHLSELPHSLKPGAAVRRGEVIARSGNSGHSFAPHLHYQLESADGRVLDPFLEHPTRRASLPADEQAAFDASVGKARAELDKAGLESSTATTSGRR
jgi:murein DD-endopeptidase